MPWLGACAIETPSRTALIVSRLEKMKRRRSGGYFAVDSLALRRDLYRAAVFLWITPFFTALSIIETVSANWVFAWALSLDCSAARNLRSAVRRREVLVRFCAVRVVVWRARFSAEKWFAMLLVVPLQDFRKLLKNLFYRGLADLVNARAGDPGILQALKGVRRKLRPTPRPRCRG